MDPQPSPPTVAIVGAPNVGKSTLFNRLIGRRQSIVSDQPGVTRDRLAAPCDLYGVPIRLIDTGGVTAQGARDDMGRRVREEALKAVREADVIVFVVDARAGVTAIDIEVAGLLRASQRPIVLVANKVDAESVEVEALEAYRLGLGEVTAISSEQGRGIDALVDRLRALLPAGTAIAEAGVPIAIVGRPNVGKSSIFNRLVGEDRALVTPIPGTTRDPVDAFFEHAGTRYRVIDTAGIRRRAGRGEEIERVSVQKAKEALERAQVAVAIVDGHAGIEHQDLAILGLVAEARVPAVVAANKWDLVIGAAGEPAERLRGMRAALRFAPYLPIVPISALTGRGVPDLLGMVEEVRAESLRRFSTPELNRALQALVAEKQPPADNGRPVRLFYATQLSGTPPRFVVFTNGRRVPASYRRFMEGRLRRHLGLEMTPLTLGFRRRSSR